MAWADRCREKLEMDLVLAWRLAMYDHYVKDGKVSEHCGKGNFYWKTEPGPRNILYSKCQFHFRRIHGKEILNFSFPCVCVCVCTILQLSLSSLQVY